MRSAELAREIANQTPVAPVLDMGMKSIVETKAREPVEWSRMPDTDVGCSWSCRQGDLARASRGVHHGQGLLVPDHTKMAEPNRQRVLGRLFTFLATPSDWKAKAEPAETATLKLPPRRLCCAKNQ